MPTRPILVTGAAGKTGRAVLRALTARGAATRALIRSPGQESAVRECGAVDLEIGDLCEDGAVRRAIEGCSAVYLICPNMSPDEPAIGDRVIASCQAAGVERLVYHSVLHPQTVAMPHHWAKLRVEQRLLEVPLDWTVLQPAAYMQNLLAGWKSIVEEGVYRVPYDVETRIGLVDLRDVAEVAARVLVEDGHARATYELAGGEAMTQGEVAAVLEDVLGRPVHLEVQARDDWREAVDRDGLPEHAVVGLLAMFRFYERYGFWGNPGVLAWLLGRPPTSFAEFTARHL